MKRPKKNLSKQILVNEQTTDSAELHKESGKNFRGLVEISFRVQSANRSVLQNNRNTI